MKVQVNDAERSQKELLVEIPYEVFEKAADKELDTLLPKAKIHGFRPGKAPREIARKQFSHQIKSQAIEKVINEAVQDALTSNNIVPISQAHISDVVFEENKPISFTARVDVFPKVELNKYKDFNFKKVTVEVNDLYTHMRPVAKSVDEQQETVQTVVDNAQVIAAGIEESNAAVSEVNRTVSHLQQRTEGLKQLIEQFKA